MVTRYSFIRLGLIASLSMLSVSGVHADILVNQQPDMFSGGFASEQFTDLPYDYYSFDDFTVKAGGFKISKVTVYGSEFGDATQNVGVHLALTSSPKQNAIGTTYSGVEDSNGNLVFTEPISLQPGHYYLTSFVERPLSNGGGQWFWRESVPVSGDSMHQEIYYHNGGNDIDTSNSNIDLAFMIEGSKGIATTVPEPSSFAAFALGALSLGALAMRRRRTAAR